MIAEDESVEALKTCVLDVLMPRAGEVWEVLHRDGAKVCGYWVIQDVSVMEKGPCAGICAVFFKTYTLNMTYFNDNHVESYLWLFLMGRGAIRRR